MVLYFLRQICCIWYPLLTWGVTSYAYHRNTRLSDNDPRKRVFRFGAVIIAPFTLPIFIAVYTVWFIISAILYGIFLVLYAIFSFIALWLPALLRWLDRIATRIGNFLLSINSMLIDFMLGNWERAPLPI